MKHTSTAPGPNRPQDPTRDSILRDPRWKRFSAGQSPPSEKAELAALSKTHPLYEEAFQLFRPWTDEESMAVLEAARAAVDGPRPPPVDASAEDRSRSRSLPPRKRSHLRRAAAILGMGAATVASAAVATFRFSGTAATLMTLALATADHTPLPDYSIVGAARASASSTQLGPGDILQSIRARSVALAPGSTLDATIVPERPVQGAFVSAYLISREEVTPWRPDGDNPVRTDGGRVLIKGTREQLFPNLSETVEVVVVVSRWGSTPPGSSEWTDRPEWKDYLTGRVSPPKNLNVQIERLKVSFIDSYP